MAVSADDSNRTIGSFGTCGECGKARESEVQDEDLVLVCPDGHISS